MPPAQAQALSASLAVIRSDEVVTARNSPLCSALRPALRV
ncbi:hypothetical protein SEEV1955_15592, partial [Salmonella enterica subsp. enterica serovar Virchow str. ATCC 51955]